MEFVVMLLGSGRTAGPVCSGVVVSCLSAFCRGPQGEQGGHMTGPRRAEPVAPIVLQQTRHFAVLLSPRCQPPPQHDGGHGSGPDVPSAH